MKLSELIPLPYSVLLHQLAATVEELSAVIDQIGFLRAQELEAQATAWNGGGPEDTITKRDRNAKYYSRTITNEIHMAEATRDALTERKWFIVRLLDRMEKHGIGGNDGHES